VNDDGLINPDMKRPHPLFYLSIRLSDAGVLA
jgi:hypothetical protein